MSCSAPPSAPAFDVDREFLAGEEGRRAAMYVPVYEKGPHKGRAIENSGPTIGKGVDMGQKDAAYLKSLGLDRGLAARLSPYLGIKGDAAVAFVRTHPLQLSEPELEALSGAVQDRELRSLVAKYDAASQVGPFHKLPRDTQTALASLYFQYGTGAPEKSTPDYWRQITTGDWEGAHGNLMDFGDHYGARRRREAELLRRDIRSGRLPRRTRSRPGA